MATTLTGWSKKWNKTISNAFIYLHWPEFLDATIRIIKMSHSVVTSQKWIYFAFYCFKPREEHTFFRQGKQFSEYAFINNIASFILCKKLISESCKGKCLLLEKTHHDTVVFEHELSGRCSISALFRIHFAFFNRPGELSRWRVSGTVFRCGQFLALQLYLCQKSNNRPLIFFH